MMPAPLLNARIYTLCPCWLSAHSANTRAATPVDCAIKTKKTATSLRKTPAARSSTQSCSCRDQKRLAVPPRFITRTPQPAVKSP
jgi:hypothetical protein